MTVGTGFSLSDQKDLMTEQNQSRFEFVTVASARAKQLLNGCTPKIEGSSKPARRAVQEVTAGLVQGTHGVDPESQEG